MGVSISILIIENIVVPQGLQITVFGFQFLCLALSLNDDDVSGSKIRAWSARNQNCHENSNVTGVDFWLKSTCLFFFHVVDFQFSCFLA